MPALTIEQRQERTRNLILDALRRNRDMTARQIGHELQVYDIWLSPLEVAFFIKGDKRLKQRVEFEFQRTSRWAGLIYWLKDGRPIPRR